MSFKPVQSSFQKLQETAEHNYNGDTIHSELGNTDGKLEINVSEKSDCRSFLTMTKYKKSLTLFFTSL